MDEKTYILQAGCDNEYSESIVATVKLTRRDAEAIRKLAEQAIALDAYSIEKYDYLPEWSEMDWDDDDQLVPGEEIRSDCPMMSVRQDSVAWTCFRKHGSDLYTTNQIGFAVLFEDFGLQPLDKKVVSDAKDQTAVESATKDQPAEGETSTGNKRANVLVRQNCESSISIEVDVIDGDIESAIEKACEVASKKPETEWSKAWSPLEAFEEEVEYQTVG